VGVEVGYDLGYYRATGAETTNSGDFRGKIDYLLHGFRGGIVAQF
jgi:hypothetical protein